MLLVLCRRTLPITPKTTTGLFPYLLCTYWECWWRTSPKWVHFTHRTHWSKAPPSTTKLTLLGVSADTTPWVKKGCHPNHGYNCQFLIDLQNSFTASKSSKFPTKSILGYSPHLKYVAALPWKIKNQKFCSFRARKTFQMWVCIIYTTDTYQMSWK